MAQVVVTVFKDSQRYFGDVQRKAKQITGAFFEEARRKYKNKAKKIHPEKAIRLAKKEVASIDHVIRLNVTEEAAFELAKDKNEGLIALGYDLAKGRKYYAVLEN